MKILSLASLCLALPVSVGATAGEVEASLVRVFVERCLIPMAADGAGDMSGLMTFEELGGRTSAQLPSGATITTRRSRIDSFDTCSIEGSHGEHVNEDSLAVEMDRWLDEALASGDYANPQSCPQKDAPFIRVVNSVSPGPDGAVLAIQMVIVRNPKFFWLSATEGDTPFPALCIRSEK